MCRLQGPSLNNEECDSHAAPPVAVPVREALPVVLVPVRVESRSKSEPPSKSRVGPNRNSVFTNKMELCGKIDLIRPV